MKRVLLAVLWFYRKWISPAIPGRCRFAPTCSAFATQAVELHGPLKGSLLTAGRLFRCHPFHPGGYDPVPEKREDPLLSIPGSPGIGMNPESEVQIRNPN